MIDQKAIIQGLKARDLKTVEQVYLQYQKQFRSFIRKYTLDKEIVEDVYQDAIIALCEKAQKGQLDGLKSSVGTYLLAICKYMVFRRLDKKNKNIPWDEAGLDEQLAIESFEEESRDLAVKLLREQLLKLGPRCQEILKMFYYEGKKLDEIASLLGYPGKDVLKSQKSRCLRQLKEYMSNHGKQ